jgi:membrane fusion protein (multidrug efflux system)
MNEVEHNSDVADDSFHGGENEPVDEATADTPPMKKMRHGRRDTDPVFRVVNLESPSAGAGGDSKTKNAPANPDNAESGDDKPEDDEDKKDNGKPRSKMPLIILAIAILILAIIAFIWWFSTRNQVSTDDAYIDGNAVVMSPIVSGYVAKLLVNDNTFVHKGDLLVDIDARDYMATRDDAAAQVALARAQVESARIALEMARVQYPMQLAQAQAQEKSALADLKKAQLTYGRQHAVDPRATTDENIDSANSAQAAAMANVESARAQLKIAALVHQQLAQSENKVTVSEAQLRQAQAKLSAADINVAYCHILAPSDGWITKRNVQLGSFLAAGTPMFILVTSDIWITANFKESQIERMRVGDQVDVTVDAYPNRDLHGHIDSIQLGSGSRFAAFPTENATGNFVKIVQRVPVKIVIDRGLDARQPLPLGLSVSPVVLLK